MCRFYSFGTWLGLSLLWVGAVAYVCYASWPQVPLDISAIDPATVEALHAAILRHAVLYGLLGAVPPLLVLLFAPRLCKA
jgi:hypothetical protein